MVALVAVTASCSTALDLPDPDPGAEARGQCTALMADLPETVRDEDRREVRPGELTAAWGDPPITLRCGVPQPPGLTRSSECWEVNGVGWFAEEAEGGMLFTTIGRGTFVEVGVPAGYTPHADALVNVAAPIEAHIPSEQPCV